MTTNNSRHGLEHVSDERPCWVTKSHELTQKCTPGPISEAFSGVLSGLSGGVTVADSSRSAGFNGLHQHM